MLLRSTIIPKSQFEAGTGWQLKPEGACHGEVCIPLSTVAADADGMVDVEHLARDIGMPLVAEPAHQLWALGPAPVNSRALTSAQAPELRLPGLDGKEFLLSGLRGKKVLLYAWAPY